MQEKLNERIVLVKILKEQERLLIIYNSGLAEVYDIALGKFVIQVQNVVNKNSKLKISWED